MDNVLWLLTFARPASARLTVSILCRLVGHILGAFVIAFPAWAVTTLATREVSGSFIPTVIGVFLIAAAIKAVLRFGEQLFGHLAAFGLMGEMRVWMIDHLIPQAPAVTDGLGAARIHTIAVRDVDRVEVFFAHTIAPAITAVLIPTAAVVTTAVLAGPLPAGVMAAVMIIGIILPLMGAKENQERARHVSAIRADISQSVSDTVRLVDDVRQSRGEQRRLDDVASLDAVLGKHLHAAGNRTGLRYGVSQLRIWLGLFAVLCAALVTDVSLPAAVAVAALVIGTSTSLDTVERLATSLPAGLEATRRIRELAAGQPAVAEPEAPACPAGGARAEMTGVSFAYPGRGDVLRDVSFSLADGSSLAIVGATGSGKSTIARLIQRHWDPRGTVTVDGTDVRELGSARTCELVAVADQEPFIKDGTVEDNLRLAHPDATGDELAEALEISGFELGLDRKVGRRGATLSGGQRQRLALARTIVRARATGAILVLDEATSHQDPITQERLMASLTEAGFTLIVIAHRLATIAFADEILVLESGEVVERGTWDELAGAGGALSRLLASAG